MHACHSQLEPLLSLGCTALARTFALRTMILNFWPLQGREAARDARSNPLMPPSGGAAPKRSESGEDELCNVLFRWTGGGMSCSVQGSWNGWGKPTPLEPIADAFNRGFLFSRIIRLPPGHHQFKFWVDLQSKYDPMIAFESDEFGNINNYIDVQPDGHRVHEPQRFKDWVSMSGEQARTKWDKASEVIRSQVVGIQHRPTDKFHRSQSQEVIMDSLTTHERQQLESALREYDLDLSVKKKAGSGELPPSGAAAASRAAKKPVTGEAGEGGATNGVMDSPTAMGNGEEAATIGGAGAGAGVNGKPAEEARRVSRPSLSLSGGGPGKLVRSRSLNDLELVHKEYSNSSLLYSLRDYKIKKQGTRGRRDSITHHPDLAAVGSCQVKSTVRREGKLFLAMVGLPGRGKTHLARAIKRHLEWLGMKVEYFSSSEYRRSSVGEKISPDFFDPTNAEAWHQRDVIARQVLDDAIQALKSSIDIAIFDAANITKARRRRILDRMHGEQMYGQVIFIESIVTNPDIIESNVNETLLRSPEYRDMSQEEAAVHFERKLQHYMSICEPVCESEGSPFLKLVDVGHKIVAHNIHGFIPGRVMLLLANIHTKPRPIWMSRHGESQYNSQGLIGGDSPLSPRGMLYAKKLFEFFDVTYGSREDRGAKDLIVWTSTMVRTGMTVAEINNVWEVIKWRGLDEIDAGICDGLTYEQVAQQLPEEYKKRKEDKYNYRYPRGESYQDVFLRLEPIIFEMLRQTSPLLIVGHQAILRILYGYLMGKRPQDCPDLPVPLHTIIQLTPRAYGCDEVWHSPMGKPPQPEGH